MVLINAIVGFVQEGKAEDALAAIHKMISPRAHVLRAGQRQSVPGAEFVPGDVVLLEAGDRVPADLRLLRARGLLIEEAALTGESVASARAERPATADAALGDRTSMAYSGTMVAAGQGTGVVIATGANVFAVGDVAGVPRGKTAASVKWQVTVVVDNLVAETAGGDPTATYNLYTSCPMVTACTRRC